MNLPSVVRTKRLLLRPWAADDAVRLKQAIDDNLAHLQAWMPWAMNEPSPLDVIAARIEKFANHFSSGTDWVYGVFRSDGVTVVGGSGLHARLEPDGLEIGYWIDAGLTRQGFATEAAASLTEVAFAQPNIQRVQIRCDPANVASAGVPRRLGYRHLETLRANSETPEGRPRDTMVWELRREEFERHRIIANDNARTDDSN